ncbi:ChaN family lipoprotein [Pseudoduganella plicata]|uniref:Haem-binding uptake Tiki superfamily ChaN domain-containing protein n=1 Tax=Pseudoduganella plicata TaxID=321984 RepID=A0A4P7BDM8_9BURK|nr:ChaN family lipoprotein [Pseudoduganella plicata]QBQ36796.1 hypothetical protein E1742_11935 [Pseudoduganella plicata]GGY72644.1 hypothetical protein GCM10007388_00840 [Pseudoduganella plicata]
MKSKLLPLLLVGALLAGCAIYKKNPRQVPAASGVTKGNPQVLLLGEVHDNRAGHVQRYEELRQRVEAGWRPVIAMEQFDRQDQDLLNAAQNGCMDAGCVIRVMDRKGWDWQQYYNIIQLALDHKLPIVAVNLSRADASKVVRDGIASSFDAKTIAEYRLGEPVSADWRKAQEREIQAGHCDMVPAMMLPGMVNAQMARDVWMAKLIREQQPRDVVLIAGNGHVRKDIGVPRWLTTYGPRLTIETIGYVEGKAAPGQFDAMKVVPAVKRPDPCAKFKK